MAKIDLSKMDRKELVQLQKDVGHALESLDVRMKAEAYKALQETAREYGFTLDEVVARGAAQVGKPRPSPPKYAKPDEPQTTWSGRGRKPGWVVAHLADGGALDELEI